MDVMLAGAMSIAMSQSQVQQAANMSIMKKAMNLQESQAAALVENLEKSVPTPPPSTHKLDILA